MRRLSRRALIGGLAGLGAATAGLTQLTGCGVLANAPGAVRPRRIGYIFTQSLAQFPALHEGFRNGLLERGWREGETVVMEWRSAEGHEEQLSEIVTELAELPVDVFLVGSWQAANACLVSGGTIPIVFAYISYPMEIGLVSNFARPGGRLTGTTASRPEVAGKRLELVKALVPGLSRVGAFWSPTDPTTEIGLREVQDSGRSIGVQVQSLEVRSAEDLDRAFASASSGGAQALTDVGGNVVAGEKARVMAFAASMRLPAVWRTSRWVAEGGLMAYGASGADQFRRAAGHVDRILRGARPGDLPIEQPSVYECSANVKAAQALGITIPSSVAAQVTEWVE